jgi:hypothetical protein
MNDKIETVKKRIKKEKELILEQLKKIPIVQIACEKTGVGRTTYYRWRQTDSKFAANADAAIFEGIALINDLAESQLFGAIRDGNLTSIIFWLKNHHPAYEERIEIRQGYNSHDEKLTKKQEDILKQALSSSLFKKMLNPPEAKQNE